MISGYVEKIVYQNADNAYCVLEVSSEEESYVLVGTFPFIEEGCYIEAEASPRLHPVYGEQYQVTSYEIKTPEDVRSIQKYLSSGAVRGIGEALAARIIKKFGEDTIRIIEEEPERLAEIKGISERMAMEISSQVEEKKDMRDAMVYLARYGISMKLAGRIFNSYGMHMYSIIRENPYRIAEDIAGADFRTADEIAARMGYAADSEYRIKAGLLYVLSQARSQGHMYLPADELISRCSELIAIDVTDVRELLTELQMEKKVIVKGDAVYPSSAYYIELNAARMLYDINKANPIEIITGGPGTGKTTNIKRIITEYEDKGRSIALAAPTGRAAKRMAEAAEHEASTIHRLLEVSGRPDDEDETDDMRTRFGKNESDPLDADVVIVDEMSMVDIYLMHALLCAITPGTKLVLVGDTNQLPSVGPGNVLHDIIESEHFNVQRLNKIWRQNSDSDIILNAHRMINEEPVDLNAVSRDFLFIKREEPDAVISAMLTLVTEKLPAYVQADPMDIQVMSPMKKGALGVERLNAVFREYLNPPSRGKTEKEIDGRLWREGDKVMQIKNDYDRGVYNGDIGIIKEINLFAELINIDFDGRPAEYAFSEMEEIEAAYAITIHKAQGSEYPAVVIPSFRGPQPLMTRNLIYTAVTRARKCVALVGIPECFHMMSSNTREMKRYSGLKERIDEIFTE